MLHVCHTVIPSNIVQAIDVDFVTRAQLASLRGRVSWVGSCVMRKGILRTSCSAVIGAALGFSSLDISPNGPNGHADWRVSLVSPAHAEQEYAILVMQIVRNLLNLGADTNQRT